MEKLTKEKKLKFLKFKRKINIGFPDLNESWVKEDSSGRKYQLDFLGNRNNAFRSLYKERIRFKYGVDDIIVYHTTLKNGWTNIIYVGPFDHLKIKQHIKDYKVYDILEQSHLYRKEFYSRYSNIKIENTSHYWTYLYDDRPAFMDKKYNTIEELFDMEELFTDPYWS